MLNIKVTPYYSDIEVSDDSWMNREIQKGEKYPATDVYSPVFEEYDFTVDDIDNKKGKHKNKGPCAYIKMWLFKDNGDHDSVISEADELADYTYDAVETLLSSKEFKTEVKYKGSGTPYSGILHTLFIYPEYRNKGLASYLVNNLQNILYEGTRNVLLNSIITLPNPYEEDRLDSPYSEEYENEDKREALRKCLKKNGFRKIRRIPEQGYEENFWLKQYELPKKGGKGK